MKIKKFNNYDVFHAFLVENAEYDGKYELPVIKTSNLMPDCVVTFSKAMAKSWTDFDCWVVFYEHDKNFERLWNNPKAYLNKLKKFKGVISPDFSLYRNMPLVMQIWNTYRGRALAVWLQENGIDRYKTVAIGTHGCIKHIEDREYFKAGLAELIKRLSPKTIIVYGAAPDDIFKSYKDSGINIIVFESEFSKSRKQVTA